MNNTAKTLPANTLLTVKSGNEWVDIASKEPRPKNLWNNLFFENDVCCLFSESNMGKSLLAVQIAFDLANSGHRVLYCDFELTTQKFGLRYINDATEEKMPLPENFYRAEFNVEALRSSNLSEMQMEEKILESIEAAMIEAFTDVVIVDNITYMCAGAEAGDVATRLMRKLCDIKKYYGVSMLVLGHTPKRIMSLPLTQNDLGGSKRLFNFLDSCFAIGKSVRGESYRYIKQLKTRDIAIQYGDDSVLCAQIVKTGSYLHMELGDTTPECDHLKNPQAEQRAELIEEAKQLHEQGETIQQIADVLKVGKSTVHRWIHS